ncbi:PHP domain-containing protein (plasmid) [Clostridium botulinum]|uniref:PHP domain-containing protein n=1 Tax=Clostridium botulinum TaxID=1491 RepID=UPI000AD4244F|nr:PHP domain-containing protein [Clostridium botulinum]MCD3232554.1 PHP domain-containing protein [Clostridium botulinum D/C]MCD3238517.1 PHP domain-containing protein [Clostridium botulinum D/C]MCD3265963.1 PHP domain-containing protein [Clostridium botulinum D/C]MCD3312952.1 PHP domain-containing protein [Clostridium botulinum D/C]MCD3316120.1 PHP domain-containing protein [Clostridium botulinum D/C]
MERVKYHSELHNHNTIGSLMDGMGTPKEILDRCDELNIKSYAITDHGTEYALYYFAELQEKYNTKILYGIELYEAYDHTIQDPNNKYFHLLTIAKNQSGIQALHRLTTMGEFEGKYFKPRIDLNQLKEFKDDLIIGSACLAGKINKATTYEQAKQYALEYKEIFSDNFYLELQAHTSEDQIKANKRLMKLHYDTNIPYIITSDSHYVKKEDKENHANFVNVNRKNADVTTTGEIYDDCYIHSTDEMYEIMFKSELTEDEITIGLQNTNKIADICNGTIQFHEPVLPEVKIPNEYKSEEEYFMALITKGWKDRNMDEQIKNDLLHTEQDYKQRVLHEYNVIKQMEYISYHLIVADYMQWAVNQRIPTAPARGSAGGSLIAYLLKITNINPLKYDLLFERYLNPERVSLPDIDSDFSSERREEVFKYLQRTYGENYVAQIINFSKYTPKVAIQDAGKMTKVPIKDVNAIKEFMQDDTIEDSIQNAKSNKKLIDLLNNYPEMLSLAKAFEGKVKTTSTNACFLGNELVMTNNGYKQIKDISIGDVVLTHTNKFKRVVKTMKRTSDDIYTLSIANTLPITTTGNHPFLVRKKIVNNHVRNYTIPEWKVAKELNDEYMMGIAINKNSIIPKYNVNLPFDNNNFWWIIGRYMGDGWCECPKGTNQKRFIICCDKNSANELNEITNHINGLFEYRYERANTTYKIFIKNKELYNYVQQFGKYAYGKRLTNDILDLPVSLLESFLEGYLSADGSYDAKCDIYGFKTVSKQLALGISACINKVYKKHCRFTVIKPRIEFIEGRKVYSKEKYDCKFSKHIKLKEHAFYEDDYIWTPLRYLNQNSNTEEVYNLSVLDDNSYTVNNIIVHNCGVVISSKPIYQYCGMKKGDNDEQLLQVDKVITEKLGMVKCDILGTTVLQIIDEVMKMADMDFYDLYTKIPLDDKETYEFFKKGLYYGVFQLGSYNMTKFFMKLQPKSIEDICLGISAYRPGSMKYIDDIINRKEGKEPIVYDHEVLEPILKPTYGICVYQEQVMQVLQAMGGFSFSQADLVRRGMAKKKAQYVLGQRNNFIYGLVEFTIDGTRCTTTYELAKEYLNDIEYTVVIEGAIHKGIEIKIAKKVFDDLEDFALYGFNKSHGLAYALLAYYTAYLKCHYPTYFMKTILSHAKDGMEIAQYLTQCKDLCVKVVHPNINESDLGFSVYNGSILYGIGSLYNVGEPTTRQIMNKRPYTSFEDFINKNVNNIAEDEIKIDKSALISLINSGCFDGLPIEENSTTLCDRQFLLMKVFYNVTSLIQKVSTTQIPELFDNPDIDMKEFYKEKQLYDLHKKILSKKNKLNLYKDDEIITTFKNNYSNDTFEIENDELNIIKNKYTSEYNKHLKHLKQVLKENSDQYTLLINKSRVVNAYLDYVKNNNEADLEFESTSFYFSKSWLEDSAEKYHVDEFKDIPNLNMDEVGYYKKKDLYTIVGVLTGKIKKHSEIVLLTNSGIVIAKLGDILYNSVASDLKRGDKIALSGYVGNGFFRAEFYQNNKSNKLLALKVLN